MFYRLFKRQPKLALELLGLDYAGDSYCFSSEEIKQTAFRKAPVLSFYPS